MKENRSNAKGCCRHLLIPYNSKWKKILDFIVLILNFLTCVIVIYETSIKKGESLHIALYVFEIIFFISIILNFFHEYQIPETFEVIYSHKEIAYNYIFRGWFIIDLVSIIPYELIVSKDLSLIRLIRIIRMAKLVEVIEHSIFENMIVSLFSSNKNDRIRILNNIRFIYKILRLITIAVMMTYFIGCIWYLFCDKMSKYFDKEDFITVYELESLSEIERMIVSCYFTLTTLTTVGYGDYVATNNAERILAIFIMLLGVGMFSYVMGNLNELISSYDKSSGVKDKTPDLHNWLTLMQKFTKKPFKSSLIKKIDKHFLYFWENDRNSSISKDDPYLTSLPKSMKLKVMEFLWGDVLNRFSNFFLYYSGNREKYHKFYYDISFLFQPRFFSQKDLIYKANEECEEMYLILEGIVDIGYLMNSGSKEKIKFVNDMKSFDWIGDFYCLFNVKSRYFYKANSEIRAYSINKFELLKALEGSEELYNKMRSRSYRRYTEFIKNVVEKSKEQEIKNLSNISINGNVGMDVNIRVDENFPNQNAPAKKINLLFVNKLRRHRNQIKNISGEIEKKCIKLDDDFMNISKKFFDVNNQIEKEIFNLNSELEEIRYKLTKSQNDHLNSE